MNANTLKFTMAIAMLMFDFMAFVGFEYLLVRAVISEFVTGSVACVGNLVTMPSDGFFLLNTMDFGISRVSGDDTVIFVNQYKRFLYCPY